MRRRGFTLVEAMVSLGLISVLLGIVASLLSNYATMVRHSGTQSATLYPAALALDVTSAELRAALNVTLTSSTVTLHRVDPWAPNWLPNPLPNPVVPSPAWHPHQASQCYDAQIYLYGDSLDEKITYPDGSVTTQDLVDGLSGLQFSSLSSGSVNVSASVQEVQNGTPTVFSLSTVVNLHKPTAVVP